MFCNKFYVIIPFIMEGIISVGKILNFHGILGIAKVGFSNADTVLHLKKVLIKNRNKEETFTVQNVKFHKNFALIKFKEINSIDELLPYKGLNIYVQKEEVEKSLGRDEFLIEDLIGLNAFDNNDDFIGIITDVKTSSGNDLLCIKSENEAKEEILIPFAKELVPIVDIKKKKVVIKPIEGLL